jgi:hypothetical protein
MPRPHRCEKNKDIERGRRNRKAGLNRKAHSLNFLYGEEVLVLHGTRDGLIEGYESSAASGWCKQSARAQSSRDVVMAKNASRKKN